VHRVVSEWRCNCHAHPSLQSRRATTLPLEVSSFVGRATQLEDIATRLRSDRVVTLTGGGGIGKTRLALQVARQVKSDYAACAWAALSSTPDAPGVLKGVASALSGGDRLGPASVDALVASIRDQTLLLVIDNCEQVIAACADLVLRLLQECPGVRVLATSREPLGVPGEVVYPVPPLAVTVAAEPDAQQTEAVQLFFARARARDPRLQSTPEAQALAGRICATLDGVPLAIELAAACTGSMTLAEIASRLDDVLGLLRLGSRAAPPRQRSVRASIDWSHRLLEPDERTLLRRLAIFDADFTLDEAQTLGAFDGLHTGEIAYLLDRLVAQSLVHATTDGATTRFCLWLPVRQYAFEQLEESGEVAGVRARLAARPVPLHLVAPRPEPVVAAPVDPRPAAMRMKAPGRRIGVLSQREHDVVLLIAGGRSNREIADELVITKKTAEAHVSHILTKLGLCSRVQIATWSLQHGMAQSDVSA
jgi:predicted ATPase/DNA-binding CsgD family transcriptional regulator